MTTAVMWQDDPKVDLGQRVAAAVDHFKSARGFAPAWVEVHPSLADDDIHVGQVLVRPCATVSYPSLLFLVLPEGKKA